MDEVDSLVMLEDLRLVLCEMDLESRGGVTGRQSVRRESLRYVTTLTLLGSLGLTTRCMGSTVFISRGV